MHCKERKTLKCVVHVFWVVSVPASESGILSRARVRTLLVVMGARIRCPSSASTHVCTYRHLRAQYIARSEKALKCVVHVFWIVSLPASESRILMKSKASPQSADPHHVASTDSAS